MALLEPFSENLLTCLSLIEDQEQVLCVSTFFYYPQLFVSSPCIYQLGVMAVDIQHEYNPLSLSPPHSIVFSSQIGLFGLGPLAMGNHQSSI
jgi:hypothetical protein